MLKRITTFTLISAMYTSFTFANPPNNLTATTTSLAPLARLSVTNAFTDNAGYSLAGEAGPSNFRAGATFGFNMMPDNRVKFSGEYLRQRIAYSFFDGMTHQWVSQSAFGMTVQQDMSRALQLALNGYYSHAPSVNLNTTTGVATVTGTPYTYVDRKRIAGSNAAGVSPEMIFIPWPGTSTGLQLNYDHVRYDTTYQSSSSVSGMGGTANLNQSITDNIGIGLSAAVRAPFNNYQASIGWSDAASKGSWSINLIGAYTHGKHALPSTYNTGISVDYTFDRIASIGKGQSEVAPLLSWVAKPAVYMPQVLAIADEGLQLTSCAPTFIGPISDYERPLPYTYDTSTYFTGNNLTYTMTITGSTSIISSINPSTGVITVENGSSGTQLTTVTATGACGSATSNAFMLSV